MSLHSDEKNDIVTLAHLSNGGYELTLDWFLASVIADMDFLCTESTPIPQWSSNKLNLWLEQRGTTILRQTVDNLSIVFIEPRLTSAAIVVFVKANWWYFRTTGITVFRLWNVIQYYNTFASQFVLRFDARDETNQAFTDMKLVTCSQLVQVVRDAHIWRQISRDEKLWSMTNVRQATKPFIYGLLSMVIVYLLLYWCLYITTPRGKLRGSP